MKIRVTIGLSALMIAFFSLSFISCKQSSKTMFLPIGGAGGGGSALVSATAVMINGATNAVNSTDVRSAFNNAGEGISFWYSYSGSSQRVLYSVYSPSRNQWSAAAEFSRDIAVPVVASNGTTIVVAFDYNNIVYVRTWSGGSFGVPVKITPTSNYIYGTTIASNGTGYCVAWAQYDNVNTRYDVHAAINDGTSWGAPAALDDTDVSDVNPGSITISTGGSSYCVNWWENNNAYACIYNGAWSTYQNVLNGYYAYELSDFKVTGNDAGRYMLIYGYASSIYARAFNSTTVFSLDEIDTGATSATDHVIASNGTTFYAVWQQYDGSYNSIYARMYNGAWVGTGEIVELDNLNQYAYEPRIVSDGTGYCAVWYQHDGTSAKIFTNRYAASSWQGAEVLNPASTTSTESANVSYNGSGYMAYWSEYDSTGPAGNYYNLQTSFFGGSAWSAPAQIDSRVNSYNNLLMTPFNGGYGGMFTSYVSDDGLNIDAHDVESTHLYANVYRNSAWGGTLDFGSAGWRGSCTRNYDIPLLHRAGANTVAIWRQYDSYQQGVNHLYASVKTGSTWSAPLKLTSQAQQYYYAASSGSAVCVVWAEYSSSRYKIFARIYSDGAWGAATTVDNDTTYGSNDPWVAGNASSNDFCVTWYQYDGSYSRTYANLHTASGWTGPVQIDNSGIADNAYTVHLAASASRYCVAFYQGSTTYGTVYNGSSWTTPAPLLSGSIDPEPNTMAGSGDQFAVTYQTSNRVYTNVHDGTGWSGMVVRNKVDSSSATQPTVTGNGSGGFCLAWREFDEGMYRILTRIYDGSSWGAAENVETLDIFEPGNNSYSPRIASNGEGYAVTFVKADAYNLSSLNASVHDGISWLGADLLENSVTSVNDYNYEITSSGSGYGVIWWQLDTAFHSMLYGTAYDGGSWNSLPLSNGQGNVSYPEVIGTSGGSFTALWYQLDAEDALVQNLWANTFD